MSELSVFEDAPELMAGAGVPGLSVAYVSAVTIEPVTPSWGVSSVSHGRPVNSSTLFRAASLSKPVTALTAIRPSGGRRASSLDLSGNHPSP